MKISPRITVRLPEETRRKLNLLAEKRKPQGSRANPAAVVRSLIEKEKV